MGVASKPSRCDISYLILDIGFRFSVGEKIILSSEPGQLTAPETARRTRLIESSRGAEEERWGRSLSAFAYATMRSQTINFYVFCIYFTVPVAAAAFIVILQGEQQSLNDYDGNKDLIVSGKASKWIQAVNVRERET